MDATRLIPLEILARDWGDIFHPALHLRSRSTNADSLIFCLCSSVNLRPVNLRDKSLRVLVECVNGDRNFVPPLCLLIQSVLVAASSRVRTLCSHSKAVLESLNILRTLNTNESGPYSLMSLCTILDDEKYVTQSSSGLQSLACRIP